MLFLCRRAESDRSSAEAPQSRIVMGVLYAGDMNERVPDEKTRVAAWRMRYRPPHAKFMHLQPQASSESVMPVTCSMSCNDIVSRLQACLESCDEFSDEETPDTGMMQAEHVERMESTATSYIEQESDELTESESGNYSEGGEDDIGKYSSEDDENDEDGTNATPRQTHADTGAKFASRGRSGSEASSHSGGSSAECSSGEDDYLVDQEQILPGHLNPDRHARGVVCKQYAM